MQRTQKQFKISAFRLTVVTNCTPTRWTDWSEVILWWVHGGVLEKPSYFSWKPCDETIQEVGIQMLCVCACVCDTCVSPGASRFTSLWWVLSGCGSGLQLAYVLDALSVPLWPIFLPLCSRNFVSDSSASVLLSCGLDLSHPLTVFLALCVFLSTCLESVVRIVESGCREVFNFLDFDRK